MSENRYETAVARYFAAWNAPSAEDVAKAVADAWTEDGSYTDPLVDVRGHDAVAAVIAGAHEQFPGFEFRPSGPVDGNHRHRPLRMGTRVGRRRLCSGRRVRCDHPGRGRPHRVRRGVPRPRTAHGMSDRSASTA